MYIPDSVNFMKESAPKYRNESNNNRSLDID